MLLWAFFLLILEPLVGGEIYSSFADLEHLGPLAAERLEALKKYVKEKQKGIQFMKSHVMAFDVLARKNSASRGSIWDNPVNLLDLVSLASEWEGIHLLLEKEAEGKGISENVRSRRREIAHDDDDYSLENVLALIKRLQDIHQLSPEDLARGNLPKNIPKSQRGLTGEECFKIGLLLYEESDFRDAIPWLQEALKRASQSWPVANVSSVMEHLASCFYEVGNLEEAIRLAEELLILEPNDPKYFKLYRFYMLKFVDLNPQIGSEAKELLQASSNNLVHLANFDKDLKDFMKQMNKDILDIKQTN